MSGGNAGNALAALVTQAPEEEASPREQNHVAEKPPSKLAQLCSCFAGQKSRAPPKLASVVPVAAPDDSKAESSAAAPPTATAPSEPPRKREEPKEEAPPEAAANNNVWGPNRNEPPQLGPQIGENIGRKTLVLDLDETLVHSSFRATSAADIVITVELEGEHHRVYVRKRPGVDEFLVQVAKLYEVVVYTASMSKYANPLLDELDKSDSVCFRLFREACTRQSNGYMKDLSKLGRDLKEVIIIDNSPICYALQPDNAIPIRTWRDDPTDRELLDLIPILYSLASVDDIPVVLKQIVWAPDE